MIDQKEAVNLLKKAAFMLGCQAVESLLPKPFTIRQYTGHDTGCQPFICASSPELPTIEVWRGSVWNYARYEFNDRDKILGLQPACEWAEAPLSKFFDAVAAKVTAAEAEREQSSKAYREAQTTEFAHAHAAYAAMVGGPAA